MNLKALIEKRNQLQSELADIERNIADIESRNNPFVAGLSTKDLITTAKYKTEADARVMYEKYCKKKYYRGKPVRGAFFYKKNEDGSKTLLDVCPIGRPTFRPPGFKQKAKA